VWDDSAYTTITIILTTGDRDDEYPAVGRLRIAIYNNKKLTRISIAMTRGDEDTDVDRTTRQYTTMTQRGTTQHHMTRIIQQSNLRGLGWYKGDYHAEDWDWSTMLKTTITL
jgi:hypothetical protein